MADFCKQCTEYLYPPSIDNDFSYIEVLTDVLCEGCGFTTVDKGGICVSNCLEKHKGV